jgi:hypothetical protein
VAVGVVEVSVDPDLWTAMANASVVDVQSAVFGTAVTNTEVVVIDLINDSVSDTVPFRPTSPDYYDSDGDSNDSSGKGSSAGSSKKTRKKPAQPRPGPETESTAVSSSATSADTRAYTSADTTTDSSASSSAGITTTPLLRHRKCSLCTFENTPYALACEICSNSLEPAEQDQAWTCPGCTLRNFADAELCVACRKVSPLLAAETRTQSRQYQPPGKQ